MLMNKAPIAANVLKNKKYLIEDKKSQYTTEIIHQNESEIMEKLYKTTDARSKSGSTFPLSVMKTEDGSDTFKDGTSEFTASSYMGSIQGS